MSPRSRPIAQRVRTVTAEIARLKEQLSSRTRDAFTSDFQYRTWRGKTNALLSDLEDELSVLNEPGEYDQLSPAVVAEERQLIKGGEILTSGRPAHEYVSREELAAVCEIGMKELLRRLCQEAAEVFEESVEYLHIARETIAGPFAIPFETALCLARAELDEVDARLNFIRRVMGTERARLIHNLQRILRGMSLKDEAAKAIAERLLHEGEAFDAGRNKIHGSKLDEQQRLAMFITTVILCELDQRLKQHLPASRGEEIRETIQSAVYSSLYAHESYDRLASSREFVDTTKILIPRYYKPARLITGLVRDQGRNDDNEILSEHEE